MSEELALVGLMAEFPDQDSHSTKVVLSPDGREGIGWLYVSEPDDDQRGPFLIQADYSGRFWPFDAKALVMAALQRVRERIGGDIRDYGD